MNVESIPSSDARKLIVFHTAWKVSKYGVFSGPNTGKYGPEKTPYLDTFHAVRFALVYSFILRLSLDLEIYFIYNVS